MFFPSIYSQDPAAPGEIPRTDRISRGRLACLIDTLSEGFSSAAGLQLSLQQQVRPLRTRIGSTAAFFIAHLVSSVIYHADRDKGKCDLHGGRRQGLVEGKARYQPEIELNDATDKSHTIKNKKFEARNPCPQPGRRAKFETISNDKNVKFQTSFVRIRCFGFS